ncbi:MAG: 2-C-methyl-D-erythritol 4-phosphate cytidylyltransferase [Sedimentisphaerales bacterium]|nr:2-C-methyl-D-erythritol 4-phosphate cytidylyltransferase [Sedimentisphaerales bacterium]
MSKTVAAIICAAGPGTRFGGKKKKQFTDVDGRAVFLRSVEIFAERKDVKQVILGIARDDEELANVKWGPNLKFFGVKFFIGGAERFETVENGLKLVNDDIDLVAVHDACRCCITDKIIARTIEAAAKTGAAIPACPVTATIKRAENALIKETVVRADLYEAQTPQIFDAALLKKAYANLKNLDKTKISDDAQLVEAIGQKVAIVQTDSSNIKITYPNDIAIAEAILKFRAKQIAKGPLGPYAEAQW